MKVIDLLNKIANEEEVPKKIIGKNSLGKKEEYIYNDFWYIHNFENPDGEEDYYYMDNDIKKLNNEVEILEEEKKIPEKIDNSYYHLEQDEQNQLFKQKINEIIDYLKSKGDE